MDIYTHIIGYMAIDIDTDTDRDTHTHIHTYTCSALIDTAKGAPGYLS